MLVVTDLNGQSELLTNHNTEVIRQKINEEYTLSFNVISTDKNKHSYPLIQEESLIECENELFVIKQCIDTPYSKSVLALHEFFETVNDFVDDFLLDGLYSIEDALTHAFSSTNDWTFIVEDTFGQSLLINFGNNNLVALLNLILRSYNAEYTVSSKDKTVRIKKSIGIETDYQVRYKHNLVAINRHTDSSQVKTAVKIYYNPDEFGEYRNNVSYYSPNKDNYRRIKWAKPLYLDTVTTENEALEIAATQLQDAPIVSITTEFVHLQEAGYNSEDMSLGNSFFLIDERINLCDTARIVEIERYPFDSKSPIVTVANKQKSITDVTVNQRQQHLMLDNTVVKQKKLYNGVTITKEDGVKASSQNDVVVWLNATEGIKISKSGIQKFYVDTNGNVTFDGRLHITSNNGTTTMLEAFMDIFGGILKVYDNVGNLNVKIGSESGDGANRGGTIVLYDDGSSLADRRVELGIDQSSGGGVANLRNSSGIARIALTADSSGNPYIAVTNGHGIVVSYLSETQGQINNEIIATRNWVRANFISTDTISNLGFATTSYVDTAIANALSSLE